MACISSQNCYNTWPFLPGHGATYERNVCVLPDSTNLGNLFDGCDCPGAVANDPWAPGDANPATECGVALRNNACVVRCVLAFNLPVLPARYHPLGRPVGSQPVSHYG